ncbi:hypothetical protein D5S17_29490 [Pseudonocardiaceae bacterium YIM PH 21723]|nr:hypothetical protein D5S17_29490 [Pseudonocardiaceae bacterium YIM PH 21723]
MTMAENAALIRDALDRAAGCGVLSSRLERLLEGKVKFDPGAGKVGVEHLVRTYERRLRLTSLESVRSEIGRLLDVLRTVETRSVVMVKISDSAGHFAMVLLESDLQNVLFSPEMWTDASMDPS